MSETNYDAFGLTEEQAENVKDFAPAYKLSEIGVGDSEDFQILEEAPRMVETDDPENKGEKVQRPVILASHVNSGIEYSLWLSSTSLKQEMFKIYKRKGTLKDVYVKVSVREYDDKKYGPTRAYTVQEDRRSKDFGLEE